MKIISWNILHGQPIPPANTPLSAEESHQILETVSSQLATIGVEVVGLQEVDAAQPRSCGVAQVAVIAQALGAEHWAYAPTIIGTPGEEWRSLTHGDQAIRTTSDSEEEASYGIGLISKIPVRSWHRKELGRSRVGLPLAIPSESDSKRSIRFIYVRDEPRVALAAELENGFTVVVTHLSFVPFVNYFQLVRIRRWLKGIPGIALIIGDLNLGWGLPVRGTHWRSLLTSKSYPSWDPKIQFDYITSDIRNFGERNIRPLEIPDLGISDHLPIGVDFD